MPRLNSSNNAETTITVPVSPTSTTFSVADASVFPNAPFRVSMNAEIMEVGTINRTNNTFANVQRGIEGTVAASHSAGTSIQNRFTAGTYSELISETELSANNTALETELNTLETTITSIATDLDTHEADTTNPHNVTAQQVGALPTIGGNLTGTLDMQSNIISNALLSKPQINELYQTQGIGSTAGQYTRIGYIDLFGRYHSSTNLIFITRMGNVSGDNDWMLVSFGAKQQNEMLGNPGVTLKLIAASGSWTRTDIYGGLSTRDSTRNRIDLFVKYPEGFDAIYFLPVGHSSGGNSGFKIDTNYTPRTSLPNFFVNYPEGT